jgi:hypothetical protein
MNAEKPVVDYSSQGQGVERVYAGVIDTIRVFMETFQ